MVLRQVASSLTALSRLTALPPAAPCHWHVRPERAAAATMTTAAALSEPASAPGPSPRAGEDAAPAAAPAPAVTPAAALDFALLLQKLKTTKRTGWVRKGVDGPESIADHMYRMGMMAMLLPRDAGVDVQRCVRMALVHDVAESIVGDITPHCKVSPEEKKKLESDAVATIQQMLGPQTEVAREVAELWHEYEEGSTPEGKLVKDLDKLEMIIQAHEYEQAQTGQSLQEFFDSTAGKWRTETGRAWAAEVVARREAARREQQQAPSGSGSIP